MSQADQALTTSADETTTSRRSVLSVGSALAASLCLPWGRAAQAVTSKNATAIQKLWLEYQALAPEIERLSREEEAASARFYAAVPPVPEEMRISGFHAHIAGLKPWYIVGRHADDHVTWVSTAGWRDAVQRPLVPAETGPTAHLSAATQNRALAREILPIAEQYDAAVAELSSQCGRDAANDALNATLDRKISIEGAILRATAETFADLLIQAKCCEAEGYTRADDDCPDWVGKALVRSILGLAARGEGTANV